MAITTFQINTNPGNGSLSGFSSSTGSVTYTPDLNFSGTDSITYDILCDGVVVDTATHTIIVNPYTANAVNDVFATSKNTPITNTVASNDTRCNASNTYYTLVPGFSTNGVTTMSTDGTFTFTPTLNSLQTGVFGYNIRCGVNLETSVIIDTATVNIKIVGGTIVDDYFIADINQIAVGKIAANDVISCDGGTITKTAENIKNGTMFSFNSTTGEFAFKPIADFIGQTDFDVKVYCDMGSGPILIGTQKVYITYSCPQALPYTCTSKAPKIVINGCLLEKDISLSVVTLNAGVLNLFNKDNKLLASIPTMSGVTNVPIPPAKLGDAYYLTFKEENKTVSTISNIATVCKAPEPQCCPPVKQQCCLQYDEPFCC